MCLGHAGEERGRAFNQSPPSGELSSMGEEYARQTQRTKMNCQLGGELLTLTKEKGRNTLRVVDTPSAEEVKVGNPVVA